MAADIQFNVDAALAKLGELVTKHGPQAIDLAAQVIRVNAIGEIIVGVAVASIAMASSIAAAKVCLPKWAERRVVYRAWLDDMTGKIRMPRDDGFGWMMGAGMTWGLSGIATLVVALPCLLNVWNWVAIFSPKLALAHTILAKIGL
jgi:hypothetical protein